MNQFILASHDRLAEGFYHSLLFFNSAVDNVTFINAYCDDKQFEDVFLAKVKELSEDNLIVFTDLPGGSVNRTVCQHMEEFHYQVVSGINLPLLLELALKPDEISPAEIRSAVEQGRKQLVYMNDMLTSSEEKEEDLK